MPAQRRSASASANPNPATIGPEPNHKPRTRLNRALTRPRPSLTLDTHHLSLDLSLARLFRPTRVTALDGGPLNLAAGWADAGEALGRLAHSVFGRLTNTTTRPCAAPFDRTRLYRPPASSAAVGDWCGALVALSARLRSAEPCLSTARSTVRLDLARATTLTHAVSHSTRRLCFGSPSARSSRASRCFGPSFGVAVCSLCSLSVLPAVPSIKRAR